MTQILINIMSESINRSFKRPLLFQSKADIHHFVHGNAIQADSLSIPVAATRTAPSFYPNTSLFDRYNKINLWLSDCDPRDVQMLTKNIIIHQQPLSSQLAEEIAFGIQKKISEKQPVKLMQTQQYFRQQRTQNLLNTAPQPLPSKQYLQNEIMFNYKEMGQLKRKQKNEFLSEIQNKIAEAQKQIQELEHLQKQEQIEMNDLYDYQNTVAQNLTRNVEIGKVKQKVELATGFQMYEERRQPMKIHQQMQPREINEVVDEHCKLNQQILQIANLARFKGQAKSREKIMTATVNGFGHTQRKDKNESKSLISTMKNGLKPKKGSKK